MADRSASETQRKQVAFGDIPGNAVAATAWAQNQFLGLGVGPFDLEIGIDQLSRAGYLVQGQPQAFTAGHNLDGAPR